MLRPDLVIDVRTAINRALKLDVTCRKEGIRIIDGGVSREVSIEVIPFTRPPSTDRFLVVLFEEATPSDPRSRSKAGLSKKALRDRELLRLNEEISSTQESLQAIIEAQEATNEEMKSANEEIQSSNEELQSTNEELETAKEELQSTNEELTTLNEELAMRNADLMQLNNDLGNLLRSINIPILMLGNDLSIRRFTPMAEKFFNLIPGDVGRKVTDINPNIVVPNLAQIVLEVIDSLRIHEHEVQNRHGRWYALRVRPYRTNDDKIDGAVLALVDIDDMKRAIEEITSIIRHPIVTLYGDLRLRKANDAFYKLFKLEREQCENQVIYQIDDGAWDLSSLKTLFEGILPERSHMENFLLDHSFPRVGRKKLRLNARRFFQDSKGAQFIILSIEET
ncbi:MAG: PAS domain-containing protein [Verrucomicrobiota bacterium]|nr:PAS domain-containing protein [Verrucomicrobiota bacterium]